jgi:hypothetical protein
LVQSRRRELSTDWVRTGREPCWRPQSVVYAAEGGTAGTQWATLQTVDAYALGVMSKTLQGEFPPDRYGCVRRRSGCGVAPRPGPGCHAGLAAGHDRDRGDRVAASRGRRRIHLPMMFATIHPWPVRRRDVKVMRLKQLPAHRDGIAAPEHCWLVAASTLNLLDLVTAGDSLLRLRRTTVARLQAAVHGYSGRGVALARAAAKLVWERVDSPAGELAAALPGSCRTADAGMQPSLEITGR